MYKEGFFSQENGFPKALNGEPEKIAHQTLFGLG
jgi:hypothetical protein